MKALKKMKDEIRKKDEKDSKDEAPGRRNIKEGELQRSFDATTTRTKLRLTEIERLIKKHRIIVPAPARSTLIRLCERGELETVGSEPTSLGWLVYEDAFWKWVASFGD